MLTIGVVDDNVGGVYLLTKLRAALPTNYVGVVCDKPFVGPRRVLFERVEDIVCRLKSLGCDVVVLSSVALAFVGRALSARGNNVFYCETPVLHASTYTISNILVASCDKIDVKQSVDNVINVYMPQFLSLAEEGNEQKMVDYISFCAECYSGQFDCIALGHSSMNAYKRCFKRVFPNAQIFDSVDGVVRRMRKKYRKYCKEEGTLSLLDENMQDISDKFSSLLQ